jgi:DNA-binding Lrp family transcriptional regulator
VSSDALTWAFRQSTSSGAKFVLVALADLADHAHRADPPQQQLADMTGQSVRTVQRCIAELDEAGLILRERRNESYSVRKPDAYRLPVQVVAGTPARPSSDKSTPVNSSPVETGQSEASGVKDTRQNVAIKALTTKTKNQTPDSAKKGTRLADDWVRSDADKAWQAEQAIPDDFAREHTAEFKDYWKAKAGAGAVKVDWSATWRNWMRRAWRERAGETYRRSHGQSVPVRDFDAERAAARVQRRRGPLGSAVAG